MTQRLECRRLRRPQRLLNSKPELHNRDFLQRFNFRINPRCRAVAYTHALTSENALDVLKPFDILLDCTDNAPTRYLLSDTAVKLGKPLVSGAAQKFEGQLCVYNLGPNGPCYRCLFPKPPTPEMAGSCADLGILGAVTGVIGNLQALEAIKIITDLHGTFI